jgi:hypothetical protein
LPKTAQSSLSHIAIEENYDGQYISSTFTAQHAVRRAARHPFRAIA